jgi:hypothetical protein
MHTLQPDPPAVPRWHQHDCAACGCAYRYRPPRPETSGAAPPCPQCGFAPAPTRRGRGRRLVVAGFAVVIATMGVGTVTASRMTPMRLSYLVAGAAVLAVAFHLVLSTMDPNSQRARNLRTARRQVSADRSQVVRSGRGRSHETRFPTAELSLIPYLCLAAVAVVTALAPVAVARVKGVRGDPGTPRAVGIDRPHPQQDQSCDGRAARNDGS